MTEMIESVRRPLPWPMGISSMPDTLRWHNIHLIKIVIVVSCLLVGCTNNDNDSQPKDSLPQSLTDFGKLIVSRPVPDLEDLAERSAPDRRGEDATEAFYDILKLRDIGAAKGVPVLEEIIATHTNSTRIHGYAFHFIIKYFFSNNHNI